MRHIVIDLVRRAQAECRGGDLQQLTYDTALLHAFPDPAGTSVLDLDRAMNLALQCSNCNRGGLGFFARARCGLSFGFSLPERRVQFCFDIHDSGFELRLFRFGGCRALTLDVDLGQQRKIRRRAAGGLSEKKCALHRVQTCSRLISSTRRAMQMQPAAHAVIDHFNQQRLAQDRTP